MKAKFLPFLAIGVILLGQALLLINRSDGDFVFGMDDAYYYYEIGRNIALGHGATFDGEHLTNGYHPLWMGVVSLTYKIFPNHPTPIYILQAIGIILFGGTLFVLLAILRRVTPNRAAQSLIIFIYALNPFTATMPIDGLETSLAVFCFALFFLTFLNTLSGRNTRNFVLLGIISGIMTLARIDYAIFVVAAFVYLFFTIPSQKRLKFSVLFLLPCAILTGPWFLYNFFSFGSFFPSSGLAFTHINHQLFFTDEPRNVFETFFWSVYQLSRTISSVLIYIGIPVPLYSHPPFVQLIEDFVFLIIGISLYYFLKKTKSISRIKNLFGMDALARTLLVLSFGLLIFTFIHGAIRWASRPWYFMTAPLLFVIFVPLLFTRVFPSVFSKKFKSLAIAIFLLLAGTQAFIYYPYYGSYLVPPKEPIPTYLAAQWINENLPQDARIASFNSGILGYYTNQFVMNSDGLVNNDVYSVMSKGERLWDFFQKEKIDYIVDNEISVSWRYKWFLGIDDPLSHLEVISSFTVPWESRSTNVYKIVSYD